MEKMKLVFPTTEYEQQAKEYITEFYEYDSEINGTGGADRYLKEDNYVGWLKKVIADIDIANIQKPRVQ